MFLMCILQFFLVSCLNSWSLTSWSHVGLDNHHMNEPTTKAASPFPFSAVPILSGPSPILAVSNSCVRGHPMARVLARTLTLAHPANTSLRGLATKVEFIEIDLSEEEDAATSSQMSTVEVARIRRLEDAVHGLLVRRASPDWLPFVPGSSFWVPPVRPTPGAAQFMERIAAAECAEGPVEGGAVEVLELNLSMTKEEALSFSMARGWPSMSFLKGKFPHSTKKTWKGTRKGATQTDDEES